MQIVKFMKRFIVSTFIVSLFLTFPLQTCFADSEKVITLGADLTEREQASILRYFGVKKDEVRIIYVTNEEERAFLSDYIPLSVIGTRTLSCAYVRPTSSGGIHVKTANLNWVTANMIASALSTSGVRNAEVIAACPKEVSGTGALTGVIKAYEDASKEVLKEEKKQVAAQEISTVSYIAEAIGQAQATEIVNDIKIEIIQNGVPADNREDIESIVDEVIERIAENKVTEEERDDLIDFAVDIAAQDYEYEDVQETLERVEENVSVFDDEDDGIPYDEEEIIIDDPDDSDDLTESEAELDEESILTATDDMALGDIIIDATTDEALPEDERGEIPWDLRSEESILERLADEDVCVGSLSNSSLVLYLSRNDVESGTIILEDEEGVFDVIDLSENNHCILRVSDDEDAYAMHVKTKPYADGSSCYVTADLMFQDGSEANAEGDVTVEGGLNFYRDEDGILHASTEADAVGVEWLSSDETIASVEKSEKEAIINEFDKGHVLITAMYFEVNGDYIGEDSAWIPAGVVLKNDAEGTEESDTVEEWDEETFSDAESWVDSYDEEEETDFDFDEQEEEEDWDYDEE